ncbi:MAG: hypothetical protein H6936_09115 [Burkholderiales bacterium]|nr:hypothetical protein [Nitrosomonas sp.]MCP5274993.1 hypothetical protein [Burkholderiales bacterium]
MTNLSIIEILELFLAMGLLMWFFNGPWQSILVDMTRQRLFEARDNLFLHAADGRIEFDSEAYCTIRNHFNKSIRFCHKINLISLLIVNFSENGQHTDLKTNNSVFNIITNIQDIELRKKIEDTLIEATSSVILLIVLRSPLLFPLFVLTLPFALLHILLKGHLKQFIERIGIIIEREMKMGNT